MTIKVAINGFGRMGRLALNYTVDVAGKGVAMTRHGEFSIAQ